MRQIVVKIGIVHPLGGVNGYGALATSKILARKCSPDFNSISIRVVVIWGVQTHFKING